MALSAVGALALALVAARWLRDERARREAAAKAARGEALTKMAAMAAHEIRNPLGVIRGTVELMRERSGAKLSERDRESLEDVLGEVERLRRLTEDLLDLSADRPLAARRVELSEVLEEAARATEAAFPGVKVRRSFAELPPVEGDAGRLRQVFANLLQNAAQAQGAGEVRLAAQPDGSVVRVRVEDDGPSRTTRGCASQPPIGCCCSAPRWTLSRARRRTWLRDIRWACTACRKPRLCSSSTTSSGSSDSFF